MDRISRQQMFMMMAEAAALRSTCSRGNVGALVVTGDDVLSAGYNGPPPGEEHCKGNLCERSANGGCLRSVHAEENALKRAAIKGRGLVPWDLYCTMQPCFNCSGLILEHPVRRVFYRHPYRLHDGLERLSDKVEVYRVTPAGFIIREPDGHIMSPEDLR